MVESPMKQRQTGRKLTKASVEGVGTSLAEIDWRLLHWLLRYPLQRVDDLVVGVARWASRATVYRHVQGLVERGLIEHVLPKTPGTGQRLSYLSNLGLHVLARHLERSARILARTWQADEAGLLRLLPRVPTLLVLQEMVNGLVTHAAEAMTSQGRRPLLVRWTWQRDVVHPFQYREQALRFFADGVIALCLRTQQADGSTLDRWYGLFLLTTALDDERLMCLRLERLFCWRESPERWPFYQYMLPVLILATTPRQSEHWQRAVESATLKLRLEPLTGSLISSPPPGRDESPWVCSWRTLSTAMSCHLQDVLRPLPLEAFPSSLQLGEDEEEKPTERSSSHVPVPISSAAVPARFARLVVGDLAMRAAHITQGSLVEQEGIALLGLRLTPCQWSVLRRLLAQPLLSDEELAALLGLQRSSVRCSLYALHQVGCLEPIPTEAGRRWHLCGRGLRLLAAANRVHIRNIAVQPVDVADRETAPIVQRGEGWLLQHIHHTAGIYRFFASLARAAREQPDQSLCWWETGAMCERRYRVGEHWYNLRPDALAEYRAGQRPLRFWLEWDRGTMNVRDLALKFTAYAHYLTSREWAREHSVLPRLLCVAPDLAQERRMHRVAQVSLRQRPGLVIRTTTATQLAERGLLAAIWSQVMPPDDPPIASSRSNASLRTPFLTSVGETLLGSRLPDV
jgi:predicted transcriptional regulator